MRRFTRALILLPALSLLGGVVLADQVIYFKSGKVIVASKTEERGGWIFLEFLGGGVLGIPAARVDRIEKSEVIQESTSIANTIESPDASRRVRAVGSRSGRSTPGANRNAAARPGVPGTLPGTQRPGRLGQGQTRLPGVGLATRGGRPSPMIQGNRGGPAGLPTIDLSGDLGQNRGDGEKKEEK